MSPTNKSNHKKMRRNAKPKTAEATNGNETSREQNQPARPVLLTVLDAARRYGVNPATIHRGIASGTIKTVRLNRRNMVLVSSIEGPAP